MLRFLLKVVAVALLVVLLAGAWLAWGLLAPVRLAEPKFVLLRPGWTTKHIANALQAEGIIRSARAFLLYHYFADPATLKAGEYRFDVPATAPQVHERLVRGDIFIHTVVIPEGFNMFEIAAVIEAAGLGTKQEFLDSARAQVSLMSEFDPQAQSLEGYLFPDTYGFTRTQTMPDIVASMVRRFRQEARSLSLTQDVHRIVTLAAIVEKETAVPEERQLVASVYQNRLNRGMALDADPTVIYAAELQHRYTGTIHQSDLQSESPYNTYKFLGLPPGPIANPGRASLQAAMHPAVSDYLYFVSDGNGRHRFARTLEEHSRNVSAYRRSRVEAPPSPQIHTSRIRHTSAP